MPQVTREDPVNVDFPAQREKITSSEYTFRIAATSDVELVEVSVDAGEWTLCRHASGYWWYDWSGYAVGRHTVSGRARMRDGSTMTSESRSFRVEPVEDAVGAQRR